MRAIAILTSIYTWMKGWTFIKFTTENCVYKTYLSLAATATDSIRERWMSTAFDVFHFIE